jgi:quercetin dioxygenase-like cupin family protein
MSIVRSAESAPYRLDGGVEFRDLAVGKNGTKNISVGLAIFDPGGYLACHKHNCEESITVLEGEAFCDVSGKRSRLHPYDTSHIAAGTPHRFVNASREKSLTILWVYAAVNVERFILHDRECMGENCDLYKLEEIATGDCLSEDKAPKSESADAMDR